MTPEAPAKTKTARKRQATQEPAAEAPNETARPTDAPDVPKTLDLLCDAVSEILTTGTDERSLSYLLLASIRHIERRICERGFHAQDEKVIQQHIEAAIKDDLPRFKTDIMAMWRHNRRRTPAAVEPKSISDLIRGNVRERLAGYVEDFLGIATPEEIRFLAEVFWSYDSLTPSLMDASSDMALGYAFELTLGRGARYLRISERMAPQVDNYVQALRAIEDKTA